MMKSICAGASANVFLRQELDEVGAPLRAPVEKTGRPGIQTQPSINRTKDTTPNNRTTTTTEPRTSNSDFDAGLAWVTVFIRK